MRGCPVLVSTIYIFRIHSLPVSKKEFKDSTNNNLQSSLGNVSVLKPQSMLQPWNNLLLILVNMRICSPQLSHSGSKGCFHFFLNFIEVELIYNVVLISAVQQSDSVIHIYILFHILFHYGLS